MSNISPMSSKLITTNGSFCAVYKLDSLMMPEVLLVQRRSDGKWELPGGGVDYDLDHEGDPFKYCAVRETFEETGVTVNEKYMTVEAMCQQRVLKIIGGEKYNIIGTVLLYGYYISDRDVNLSFTGEETLSIRFVSVSQIDYTDEDIHLGSRRMIGILHNRCMKGIGLSSSFHPYGGNLGHPICVENKFTRKTITV